MTSSGKLFLAKLALPAEKNTKELVCMKKRKSSLRGTSLNCRNRFTSSESINPLLLLEQMLAAVVFTISSDSC